ETSCAPPRARRCRNEPLPLAVSLGVIGVSERPAVDGPARDWPAKPGSCLAGLCPAIDSGAGASAACRKRQRSGDVRPALLRRFPQLRADTQSGPVLPPSARADFPALRADFDVLDREVAGAFAEFDLAALRGQNGYRRQQVLILLGSAFLTGLGGLQA